jgi:hypothetical protein
VTLESRDVFGNVSGVGPDTSVDLSGPADFQYFTDPGCTVPAGTSLALPAGTAVVAFWFEATVVATPATVTATVAGWTPVSIAETITPAAPAAVVFTTDPQAIAAGTCSDVVRVELRDAYGNPTADPGAAIPLALSAAPAGGFELFEDAACAVAVPGASIEIAAGSVGKEFWFRGTVAGTVTVASSPAGLTPASQDETIGPAPPDRLVFATAAQSVVAGACSAVATVRAEDVHGNASPVAADTAVSLSAAPASGFELFGSAGCGGAAVTSVTMGAGQSTASFWYRGTVAGIVTVTADGAGIPTVATQDQTVQPGAADRLVFVTAPQTVAAGTCSGVATVQAEDAYGNVSPAAADTAVSLSASPASGFAFHAAEGCGGGPVGSVTMPSGQSTASFWFEGTAAGTVTVTASGAGIPAAATQDQTVEPGPTAQLAWDSIASPQLVDVPFAVTVRALDAYGNATPGFTGTATLSVAAPSVVACTSGCSSGTTTVAFVAGVWIGQVALRPAALAVQLLATSGAIGGTSGAFDVLPGVVYEVGSFVKSTGAAPATQAIPHALGFVPAAIVLWTAGQAVQAPQDDYLYAIGLSDGATSRSFAVAADGANGMANVSRRHAAKALTIVEWGEVLRAEADLAAWDTTSFTLSWTANDTQATVIHYLLVGGAAVSAKVVDWQMPTAAGSRSVTGVGFAPDLVLHAHAGDDLTSAAPYSGSDGILGFGAMNAAGEQWSLAAGALDVNWTAVSGTASAQRTDGALLGIVPGTVRVRGSFASMDADGFTMSFPVASGAGRVASLALRGVGSRLGSFAKATATGNQAVAGVGFQPEAVMLASYDAAASTAVQAAARLVLGASDGAIEGTGALVAVGGSAPTNARGLDKASKVFSAIGNTGAVRSEADLVGFDADGFTLDWTTNAAPASQVLHLSLGRP